MSARDRILGRVRSALLTRDSTPHPGPFAGRHTSTPARATEPTDPPELPDTTETAEPSPTSIAPLGGGGLDLVARFTSLFEAAGGELVEKTSPAAAAAWLDEFASGFDGVSTGTGVPDTLRPSIPERAAEEAPLGLSMASGAVAETGSLLMDARDGRRSQLLPPTHVVFVRKADLFDTLREALETLHGDLPSALGLHSGPSKSADIGQTLVRGVHGPGRLIAVMISGSA